MLPEGLPAPASLEVKQSIWHLLRTRPLWYWDCPAAPKALAPPEHFIIQRFRIWPSQNLKQPTLPSLWKCLDNECSMWMQTSIPSNTPWAVRPSCHSTAIEAAQMNPCSTWKGTMLPGIFCKQTKKILFHLCWSWILNGPWRSPSWSPACLCRCYWTPHLLKNQECWLNAVVSLNSQNHGTLFIINLD